MSHYKHCYVARRWCGCAVDVIASTNNAEYMGAVQSSVINGWIKDGLRPEILPSEQATIALQAGQNCPHRKTVQTPAQAAAQEVLPL